MKKEKDVMSRHQGIGAGIVKAMLWVYSSFAFLILIYIAYNSLRPVSYTHLTLPTILLV